MNQLYWPNYKSNAVVIYLLSASVRMEYNKQNSGNEPSGLQCFSNRFFQKLYFENAQAPLHRNHCVNSNRDFESLL